MGFDYLKYDDGLFNFSANEKDFITFLGEKNKMVIDSLMFVNENDFITINYFKVNKKNVYKLRQLMGFASLDLIDSFAAETVKDEMAFVLESEAKSKKDMEKIINEVAEKFSLTNKLDSAPLSLSLSDKAKLSIARVIISNPKVLVIDNILSLLDKDDYLLVKNILKEYIDKQNIVLNFTYNVESTLLGNKIIVTDKERTLIEGETLSVLNEEKIMKRLGISLPFIVLLNKYLKDYELIDKYIMSYDKLGEAIWK